LLLIELAQAVPLGKLRCFKAGYPLFRVMIVSDLGFRVDAVLDSLRAAALLASSGTLRDLLATAVRLRAKYLLGLGGDF
jgi:hypothetical protein